jgi:hypothetical protein
MPLIAIVLQESGLTFHQVLAGIPHDAPAFVGYALVVAFLYFVWRGSRNRPGKQP